MPRRKPRKLKGQMNKKRARWAHSGLMAFQVAVATEDCDLVADFLCDLMHFCDRDGFDFDAQLDRAKWHYNDERTGVDG